MIDFVFDHLRLTKVNSAIVSQLRERALACGGELQISGQLNRGTTVSLKIPLATGSAR